MSGNCNRNVGGARDRDDRFKVKVNSHIDGDEFCRGVRRCLRDVLSERDDHDRDRNRHHDRGCRWF
jgi:hypothetical protein